MGDQEHVYIKLFYPSSVGQVTESDLDQILTDIKKDEVLWPVVCTMIAPVMLSASQSQGTDVAGGTTQTTSTPVPPYNVPEIYCKTLSSTVGANRSAVPSILLELMCNFTDKTIVDKVVSALKTTVTRILVTERKLPPSTGVYILKMPLT